MDMTFASRGCVAVAAFVLISTCLAISRNIASGKQKAAILINPSTAGHPTCVHPRWTPGHRGLKGGPHPAAACNKQLIDVETVIGVAERAAAAVLEVYSTPVCIYVGAGPVSAHGLRPFSGSA
jgi:hypothetical protein